MIENAEIDSLSHEHVQEIQIFFRKSMYLLTCNVIIIIIIIISLPYRKFTEFAWPVHKTSCP